MGRGWTSSVISGWSAFHISCMMGTCGSHQLPTQMVTEPLGCAERLLEPAASSAAASAGACDDCVLTFVV